MQSPKETIPLGPWRGINNIEDELSSVYQPGDEAAFVREAVNVNLTKDGWFSRRAGRTKLLSTTDAHSLKSVGGRLLYVDSGALCEVGYGNPTVSTVLASGLGNGLMSYELAAGEIFCCNGSTHGRVSGGVWTHWGLEPPSPPALAASTGNMPAGSYLVALTSEDANGLEGGARVAATITLSSTGGITVSNFTIDSNATYTNVYCSTTNGKLLFWAGRISAAETSYTLVSQPESGDPLERMGMYGPPPEARMVKVYRGRLLVIAHNALYWSQPLAYHLFRYSTDMQLFAEEPVLLAPTVDGFYIAEGSRTWWVSGDDPENWSPILVDDNVVAQGDAIYVPGHKIPNLQTTALTPLWASRDGLVAGLPGGILRHLTRPNVTMNTNANASLAYREQDGLAQVLMNLRNKTATTGFAASDRVTATVVRANVASI